MTRLRHIASWIHLYGGLVLGGFLIVISVSGSVLVFKDTIDQWLRPDLLQVDPGDNPISVDRIVAAIRSEHPDESLQLLELPDDATAPVVAWLTDGSNVYADPYRGTVLGRRGPEEGLMNTLSALHVDLLAGTTGHIIVGITGLLLVLLTLTGVVLWWPRHVGALWAALCVSWRHGALRFNYDLHRAGGAYTALFLLLTALTGSAFVFYPTTQQLIGTLTASEPWPPAPPQIETSSTSERDAQISFDSALRAARTELPSADVSFVYVPRGPNEPVTVRLRTPPEWHPNGRSFVYVRPADASVLRVDDARDAPGGAQVLQTFYPLHVGTLGGPLVKWLYVVLGLAPALLSITGTIIWYRRHRPAARRSPPVETAGTRAVEMPLRPTGGDGQPTHADLRSDAADG